MKRILPLLLLVACSPIVQPVAREVRPERKATFHAIEPSPSRPPQRATRSSKRPHVHPKPPQRVTGNTCKASWYRHPRYPGQLITAHLTLPMGTRLRVTYGDRSVVVVVRDRGPAAWTGRCLDLSAESFRRLAPLSTGVINVKWRKV